MKTKRTAHSLFLKIIASFTIFMTVGIFTLASNLETVSSTNVNSINVDSTDVDSKSSIVLQEGVVNEVKAGDKFSISLPVTPLSSALPLSEVYAWFTSFCTDGILILDSISFEDGIEPSYQIITLQAIGPGSCNLTFAYSSRFGDVDSVKETITYTIKVLPEEVVPADGVILDDQKINEVHISDVVKVQLPSNPSTGYIWCYGASDPSALRLISSDYVDPDSSVPGASGTQIFTFRIMHKGMVELIFRYRPAEGMANDNKTAAYDVFILPGLNRYVR